MASVFDEQDKTYLILVNELDQHSIWPDSLPIPDGWRVIHGPAERHMAVNFVDTHWTDLRPRISPANAA